LLELLVVLFVVGLLVVAALPLLSGALAGTRLQLAARDVAATLTSARAAAMMGRRDVSVVLDLDSRQYRIEPETRGHSLPERIELSVTSARSALIGPTRSRIRFFPDGSSSGGVISLKEGGQAFRVTVDWLTGRVSIDG
jgi:general secretion pathway protein H